MYLETASNPLTVNLTVMLGAIETIGAAPFFGLLGIALAVGLGAFGSAMGIGAAGQAAAGAWAKESKAGKSLSFTYIIMIGAPLSQTLYAMIVMSNMATLLAKAPTIAAQNAGLLLGIGIATGLGEMLSAW